MITKRQIEILLLLYKFRFLTRSQIQYLLNHKQFNRIIVWLNELTTQGYIQKYYDKHRVNEPAIYSLGLQGRKYLKKNQAEKINFGLLNRIWRESKTSKQFKDHNLFIADCHISLCKLVASTGANLHFYTKTDLYGMEYLIIPNPDAYFSITEKNGRKTCYFLEEFEDILKIALRKRIRQYIDYYNYGDWQEHSNNPFPNIILVCHNYRILAYLNHYIRAIYDDEHEPVFYLSTIDEIKKLGLVKDALHKVEKAK